MSKIETRHRSTVGPLEHVATTSQPEPVKARKTSQPNEQDRVELSVRGESVAVLTSKAMALPAERTERMQELKTAIENGSYAPDYRAVAKKLLEAWSV